MWIIRVGDEKVESDDFLIEDLEAIEKAGGSPWSIANPLRDIKVARAFLAVAMLRQGKTDRETEAELKKMTLKTLKGTFEYRSDDDVPGEDESEDPLDRPVRISRGSSRGRPVKGGSRPLPAENVSETS